MQTVYSSVVLQLALGLYSTPVSVIQSREHSTSSSLFLVPQAKDNKDILQEKQVFVGASRGKGLSFSETF